MDDKIQELQSMLRGLQQNNEQVEKKLESSTTCENAQILEVLMEQIILRWDDIVELLLDDLVREEVHELNEIESKTHGTKPSEPTSMPPASRQ